MIKQVILLAVENRINELNNQIPFLKDCEQRDLLRNDNDSAKYWRDSISVIRDDVQRLEDIKLRALNNKIRFYYPKYKLILEVELLSDVLIYPLSNGKRIKKSTLIEVLAMREQGFTFLDISRLY